MHSEGEESWQTRDIFRKLIQQDIVINGKWRRRDNEEWSFGLGNRGMSFCVAGKMEEAVVNGKMMNSILDILGSKKMWDI